MLINNNTKQIDLFFIVNDNLYYANRVQTESNETCFDCRGAAYIMQR